MVDKTFKQLQGLLEPIQKNLVEINRKLDQHDKKFEKIDKKLGEIDEKLGEHTIALKEVDKKLGQHTSALINIENTITMYGDMYQINNDNAKKLEKRINVLEDKGEIVPPSEFRLASI